jgi:hypothetical protein
MGADFGGRGIGGGGVNGVGLRALACWNCEFESRRGHGCQSLVCVVCCQVVVSATNRPLVHRSLAECRVSECDQRTLQRRPRRTKDYES